MTIKEKIAEAESLMLRANELLAEAKAELEMEEENKSILVEYWNYLNNDMVNPIAYYINSDNEISSTIVLANYNDLNTGRYSLYPNKQYAEYAQKLKEFNDKLLAFKWCYDRDYIPVFSGDYDNRAYFICYDSEDNEYNYDWDNICNSNVIYFSSKKIAQECCDWLNGKMKGE